MNSFLYLAKVSVKVSLGVFALVILLANPIYASAATYYHNGVDELNNPNSWFLDSDFNGPPHGSAPTSGDIGVVFPSITQSTPITLDYELQIENGGVLELSTQLTFNNGGRLRVLDNGIVNVNTGGQIEMQSATQLHLENGSVLNVLDNGSLVVQNTANLVLGSTGQLRVESGGTFTQQNAEWNIGGTVTSLQNLSIGSGKKWIINGGQVSLDAGAVLTVQSGGSLDIEPSSFLNTDTGAGVTILNGGSFNIKTGATFNIFDFDGTFIQNNPTWTINGNLNFSNDFAIDSGLSWTAASSSRISLNNTANFRVTNDASLTVLSGATFIIGEFSSFAVSLTGSFINYGAWINNGGVVSLASSGSIINTVPSPYLLSGVVSSPISPYALSSISSDNETNYNAVLSQSGDVWSSSNLPAGIAINPATGVLTGVPSAEGSGSMSISCTNSTTGSVATQFVAYIIDPIPDTTAPIISSILIGTPTTTGVTIAWNTNESATSTVSYGVSTSYGSIATSTGTTTHSVTLSGLAANTAYNFRINSVDTSLNIATTSNAAFTTAAVVVSPPSGGGGAAVMTGGGSTGGGGGFTSFLSNILNTSNTTNIANMAPSTAVPNSNTSSQTVQSIVTNLSQNKNTFLTNTGTPFVFTKNITRNTPRVVDAKKLQVFLNSVGFPISNRGAGSPGLENTRFGPQTRAALAKFQKTVGITPALGNFGPITRTYVNSMIKSAVGR